MDALVVSILSSAAYDLLKTSVTFTSEWVKDSLKNWIIDDITAQEIANAANKLKLNDELSEKAIQKIIESDAQTINSLKNLKPSQQTINITQNHSGTGDNIGRDKIC